ncbi:MAG: regulatory protein RecX [Syntrophomonadaceae bacterium]|jgi:regulatory protein|nr:regulatory protein RecX [Syntrophomonadaceae bacterium]
MEKDKNRREQDALHYAFKLLAIRNRSAAELLNRFELKGFSRCESENTVLLLQEKGYVDDTVFTRSWIQERIKNKPMGRKRLLSELAKKGISLELCQEEVAALLPGDTELRIALQLARKHWERSPLVCPHKKIVRIAWLLARRGFSSGTINQVCAKLYSKKDVSQEIEL